MARTAGTCCSHTLRPFTWIARMRGSERGRERAFPAASRCSTAPTLPQLHASCRRSSKAISFYRPVPSTQRHPTTQMHLCSKPPFGLQSRWLAVPGSLLPPPSASATSRAGPAHPFPGSTSMASTASPSARVHLPVGILVLQGFKCVLVGQPAVYPALISRAVGREGRHASLVCVAGRAERHRCRGHV